MNSTVINRAPSRSNTAEDTGTDWLYAVFTVNEFGKLVCWGETLLAHPMATHRTMIETFDQLPPDERTYRADKLDFWFNRSEALELADYLPSADQGYATLVPLTSEHESMKLQGLMQQSDCTGSNELSFRTERLRLNQVIGFHTGVDAAQWLGPQRTAEVRR
jgi:hypothetical protein